MTKRGGKEVVGKVVPAGGMIEVKNLEKTIVVDKYLEDERLSKVISDVGDIVNKFRNKLSVEVLRDPNGPYEIIITARIQIAR